MVKTTLILIVAGLSVAKPDLKSPHGESLAKGLNAGTKVYFVLADKERLFTQLNKDESKLTSFVDDKGTNLLESKTKKKSRYGRRGGIDSWPKISKDGHSLQFSISGPGTPASGAKEILVKGKIVVELGGGEKTAEQKDVELRIGSEIKAGPAPMIISKLGKGWGKWKFQIELETGSAYKAIKKIAFFDEAGKEIESNKSGWSSSGSKEKKKYNLTYNLLKMVNKVTVKITYFSKLEKIAVPIDRKIGVGL